MSQFQTPMPTHTSLTGRPSAVAAADKAASNAVSFHSSRAAVSAACFITV